MNTPSEQTTYAKVMRRLLPLLFGCYALAYVDRINIGFAKLQMASDLGLSDTVYGLGAGVFFLGYLLLEIPSNLVLARVGARLWIARIMIAWGLISAATAFVHSPLTLYIARFFLGAAEAGFFPGIVFYLTLWFPDKRRAHVIALLMTAVAFAGVTGSLLSGAIMQNLAGVSGLKGWQWLFLLEGLPSILAGIIVFFALDSSVAQAKWLEPEEKKLIVEALAAEEREKRARPVVHVFADTRIWLLGFIYFCFSMGLYGVGFWLPQLMKNAGVHSMSRIGLLSAIPYGASALGMVWIARCSDASGERRVYIAACTAATCVGLIFSALYGDNLAIALSALTLATVGTLAVYPLLWTFPAAYLSGGGAAAGIALVNSIGALAGFLSPYLVGAVQDASKSPAGGLLTIAAFVALGGVLVITALPAPESTSQHGHRLSPPPA